MAKRPERERRKLLYPVHRLKPTDFLRFVYDDGFVDDRKRLNLDDDDLRTLEVLIMARPKGSPVVQGTGGLRKARFAPDHWGVGKSGAARICYALFEEHCMVYMMAAYGKSRKDNLTAADKSAIRSILEEIEYYLETPSDGQEAED